MCMWMRLRLFPWQDRSHAQRSLRCADPYASLLFDNCAPLNHSIGVHARHQRGTQKEAQGQLKVLPWMRELLDGCGGVSAGIVFLVSHGLLSFLWRLPWKIFSHAAASGRPQSPFPLRQTAATTTTTATAKHERVPFRRCTLGPSATACLLLRLRLQLELGYRANKSTCSNSPKVIDEVARQIYDVKL